MAMITARDGARELEISTRRLGDLLRSGRIVGELVGDRFWLADEASIAQYRRTAQSAGRAWSVVSSWALLDMLSGGDGEEADTRTHYRLHERIRELKAREIALKVATRVRLHRFAADDRNRSAAALVLTGVSAEQTVTDQLTGRATTVEGYLRRGSVEQFAREQLLVPDVTGDVVVYESLDGRTFGESILMPTGVVAADLARSMHARERAAGLSALENLQSQWQRRHTR